jgi:hypothetical protein
MITKAEGPNSSASFDGRNKRMSNTEAIAWVDTELARLSVIQGRSMRAKAPKDIGIDAEILRLGELKRKLQGRS